MRGLLCLCWSYFAVGQPSLGVICPFTKLTALTAMASYRRRGGRRTGPCGVMCVVASSRATRVVDYCSAHCVRAPGLSHVTGSNMHFAGDFITGSLDNPDHTYVVANGRDYTGGFCSGAAYIFSDTRRAFPGLLRGINCRATLMKG